MPDSSHGVLLQPGPHAATYLEAVLTQHIQADRLIGSFYLIGVVQEQFKVIEMCLNNAEAGTRREFLRLANRYAEFCGWLHQDQGRFADAED